MPVDDDRFALISDLAVEVSIREFAHIVRILRDGG